MVRIWNSFSLNQIQLTFWWNLIPHRGFSRVLFISVNKALYYTGLGGEWQMVTSASLPMMRRLQSVCSDLADLAEQNDMMVRSYSDNCVSSRSPPSAAASTEEIRSEERRVGKECRSRWSQ